MSSILRKPVLMWVLVGGRGKGRKVQVLTTFKLMNGPKSSQDIY